jgi:hypothetical protein
MKKNLILAIALLVPVIIAGCIASGTLVIVYDIEGFASSDQTVASRHIDLTSNSDYNDNKDKIKSVDAITLVGNIINNGNADAIAEAWISDDSLTTVEQIRTQGTLIFESSTIPAGDTLVLEWADGTSFMRNQDLLKDEIKDNGNFFVYGMSSGQFNIEYQIEIIIAITVGL